MCKRNEGICRIVLYPHDVKTCKWVSKNNIFKLLFIPSRKIASIKNCDWFWSKVIRVLVLLIWRCQFWGPIMANLGVRTTIDRCIIKILQFLSVFYILSYSQAFSLQLLIMMLHEISINRKDYSTSIFGKNTTLKHHWKPWQNWQ